jgi:6-phosphofructo-2-kinase/fructose-2,6-biphosphatase 2
MNWLGVKSKVFNVGNYRRELWGAHVEHTFFDPTNEEATEQRFTAARMALEDMFRWFKEEDGGLALYDATNSTNSRRKYLSEQCEKEGIQVMFIESICDDQNVVLQNIMAVKTGSPDYRDVKEGQEVVEDFQTRISHYESAYESITDLDLTFIKLINVGSKVVVNKIKGYLESRIVYYLMNLHIVPRTIYLSRHGESIFNVEGKIGGDSDLSPRGLQYSQILPELLKTQLGKQKIKVWTSTARRTISTARNLDYPQLQWKALDELDAGVCDGMTYEEIEVKYPDDFMNRDHDKYNYRYRGGESYKDVVLRLEPVIMELERQENILIVGHQAILRCIYAYFMNYNQEELPYIKIPLHSLIKLTPMAYGTKEELFRADIHAVDTHRPKPE